MHLSVGRKESERKIGFFRSTKNEMVTFKATLK